MIVFPLYIIAKYSELKNKYALTICYQPPPPLALAGHQVPTTAFSHASPLWDKERKYNEKKTRGLK